MCSPYNRPLTNCFVVAQEIFVTAYCLARVLSSMENGPSMQKVRASFNNVCVSWSFSWLMNLFMARKFDAV